METKTILFVTPKENIKITCPAWAFRILVTLISSINLETVPSVTEVQKEKPLVVIQEMSVRDFAAEEFIKLDKPNKKFER